MESLVRTDELQTRPVLLMSLQDVAVSSSPAIPGECQPITHPDTGLGSTEP